MTSITSDEFTSSGYDDITKTSHKQNVTEIMEPEKETLRFYSFIRMKLGDSPMKIHEELESVYGTSSCSYDTVCQWIRHFQSGKKDFRDEPWSGAPNTAMNENAIELVTHAIADDPHISIQDTTEICYLSHGAILWIFHEELGMKKVCAKWVPYLLTGAQKMESDMC